MLIGVAANHPIYGGTGVFYGRGIEDAHGEAWITYALTGLPSRFVAVNMLRLMLDANNDYN